MALIKAAEINNMKEEQIWGVKTPFYEKRIYRDDKVAINLRRVPPREKIQSEGGYKLHSHDESTEIVIVLKGKGVGHCGSDDLSHEAGDILVIPPNTEHGSVSVEEEWTSLAIFIPPPKERY